MKHRALLTALVGLLLAACGGGPPGGFTSTWLGPDGEPADRGPREFEVRSIPGDDHCEWQSVVFLSVAWPPGTTYEPGPDAPSVRQYVRDADDDLGPASQNLRRELDLDAELPTGADYTGYHTDDGVELWIDPEEAETSAYLVIEEDNVERWPRAEPPIACR